MKNKELVSKVKFALIEKYTVKSLQPMEDVINDTIEKTLEAINYNSCCVNQPSKETQVIEVKQKDCKEAFNNEVEQLQKEQECYKTSKPCPYGCQGLCKDS